MTLSSAPTSLSEDDYGSIATAVMETTRGRWFLAEYARRNRTADTEVLLDAIARLQRTIGGGRPAPDLDPIRTELVEMARAIARTRAEIAAIRPGGDLQSRFEEATIELDDIVRTTERATSEILDAAEHVQEAAWTLREQDAEETLCDALDKRSTDIYVACAFQDLTAQRTTKVIQVLRYLEGRIHAMIEASGGVPAGKLAEAAPAPSRGGLSQTDVDVVIVGGDGLFETVAAGAPLPANLRTVRPLLDDDLVFVETAMERVAPAAARVRPEIRREALAAIDRLDTREKLLRFT